MSPPVKLTADEQKLFFKLAEKKKANFSKAKNPRGLNALEKEQYDQLKSKDDAYWRWKKNNPIGTYDVL